MRYMRNSDEIRGDASPSFDSRVEPTGMFVMPRGFFFRSMAVIYGWPWLVAMLAAFFLGVGVWLASADVRWFIVSLMMVFIVFPMLAAFLYFSHGLRAESFFNVVPHRLSICEGGLEAVMFSLPESEEKETHEEAAPSESGEREENSPQVIGRVFLPYASMRGYRVGQDSVTIPCGGGLIWLPMSAFASKAHMERMIDVVSEGVRANSRQSLPISSGR